MSDEQMTRIENTLDALVKGQGALKSDMDTRFKQMRDRMDVLHEELRDDIKDLGEADAPTRREMRHGFDDLRELIKNRLIPVEAAVRHHTAEIKKLKKVRS
jgi:hypothetical protein